MDILGSRVVVTGGASGIGKALAKAFIKEKSSFVLIVDVDIEKLEETKIELNCDALRIDVSKEEEIKSLVNYMNDKAGGIDIFCSNAGIGGVPGFFDVTIEDWQNIWDINVIGHIHAAKYVLPQMLERGNGYLMNTASAAGLLTQIGSGKTCPK